jgi:hypothetical protein
LAMNRVKSPSGSALANSSWINPHDQLHQSLPTDL